MVNALGLAQMGAENDLRAVVGKVADGGDRAYDAVIVGHFAVLQRHVKVYAHQHTASLYVQIFHSYFVQKRHTGIPLSFVF